MSLINDALKRTKEVQQQTPPTAEGPALRPVDPKDIKAASSARTFLFVMVAAVIIGNVLLWLAFQEKTGTGPDAPATTALPEPVPAAPVIPSNREPAPAVSPAPVAGAVAPSTTVPPAASDAAATSGVRADEATNDRPAVVFIDPPKPTVLRLQSIIFSPTRPSAMIVGKFLFVGDRIQGHQVIAIDKESVTLAGNGQTNVLSLP